MLWLSLHQRFLSSHGCCVNSLYNTTILTSGTLLSQSVSYSQACYVMFNTRCISHWLCMHMLISLNLQEMGVVDYALWNSCNVKTPGVCRESLAPNSSEKKPSHLTVSMLSLMAVHSLLVYHIILWCAYCTHSITVIRAHKNCDGFCADEFEVFSL